MDSKQKESLIDILKGGGIVFSGLMFSKLLMYSFRLIVARIGVEQYGTLSIGMAILELIAIIAVFGMDIVALRYISYYNGKNDKQRSKAVINFSIRTSFILSIILGNLLFFSSSFISVRIFNVPELIQILKLFAITIPFYVMSKVLLNILKAYKKIKTETFTKEVWKNSSRIVLTLILIYLGYGLMGATLAYSLSLVTMCFLALFFYKHHISKRLKNVEKGIINRKELLLFSYPIMLSGIFLAFVGYSDTFFIGFLLTTVEAGIYNSAMPTAAAIMILVPTAMYGLFIPILTGHFARKEFDTFRKLYNKTSLIIAGINIPISLILIAFPGQILSILFGAEYVSGAAALSILAIGYLFYSIFYMADKVLIILKKTKYILYNSIIVLVLNIILNFYLISNYGIIGGAIATSVSLFVFCSLSYIEMRYFMGCLDG